MHVLHVLGVVRVARVFAVENPPVAGSHTVQHIWNRTGVPWYRPGEMATEKGKDVFVRSD